MRPLALPLVGALLLPCCARAAASLELGYGTCHAEKSAEGTWWQEGYEHHLKLSDNCGEVGLSFSTPMSNVFLKTRYTSLGQYETRATANADDNDDKSRRGKVGDPARKECDTGFHADCNYQFNGSGGAKAFVFAVAAEPFQIGPLKLGAEAGIALYEARWRETIRPINCPGNECWQMQIDQRTRWQRAPVFGVTARWDYVYAAVRRYDLRMPGSSSPTDATQAPGITAGFRAPIYQFLVGAQIPISF